MTSEIKPGWQHVVHELLTSIKRACARGRNSAGESNIIATCDHVEDLADQALKCFIDSSAGYVVLHPAALVDVDYVMDLARSGVVVVLQRDVPRYGR